MNYTIRSAVTGAVIQTGWFGESEREVENDFIAENPDYSPDDIYASEAGWND